MKREELVNYLDGLLMPGKFRDYCPNGLQVEGREEVLRVVAGVTASQALLDAAVEASGKSLNGVDNGNPMLVRQTFYDTLFDISGNDELPRVTPLSRADLFRAQIRPYQSHEEQRKHAEGYGLIAQAVLSGDPDKAEAAVRTHFEATRQMVDRLPPQAVE